MIDDEEAIFAANEQIRQWEVTAIALTADGSTVAVGTSIGQIKLFQRRDRRITAIAG